MEKKLTEGRVFKALLFFSLPYLLSYFLQTLYGMADLFIIGQYNGVDSTTAVSVGSQVMNMFTVMIVGLAMGATVMIGRCVGSNDFKQMAKVIGNTVTFFMGFSIVICKKYSKHSFYTGGGCFWHNNIFDNLLYGHTFYSSLQYY